MKHKNGSEFSSIIGVGTRDTVRIAAMTVFAVGLWLGGLAPAVAQRRATTVDVGRTASYGLQKEVYPRSIKISSNPRGIATVRLDTDKSKLRIVGTSPGNTLVTVSGTYRELQVGGRVVERARPFKVSINVTVLPRRLEPDRRAIDVQVSRGKTRNYQINTFMGPEFTNEERNRWRNFRVNPGDNGIARARLNGMSIGITGVNRGRTTITLTGERRFQGAWQQVVRNLQVSVGAATRPGTNPEEERPDVAPSDEAGTDAWLDGVRRQYKQLQPSVESGERGDLSAEQKAEVRRRLENLATVVQNGIRSLENDPNRREERLTRRRNLLAEIERDIRRVQGTQSQGSLSGIWRFFQRDGSTAGSTSDFRVEEDGATFRMYPVIGPRTTANTRVGTRQGNRITVSHPPVRCRPGGIMVDIPAGTTELVLSEDGNKLTYRVRFVIDSANCEARLRDWIELGHYERQ